MQAEYAVEGQQQESRINDQLGDVMVQGLELSKVPTLIQQLQNELLDSKKQCQQEINRCVLTHCPASPTCIHPALRNLKAQLIAHASDTQCCHEGWHAVLVASSASLYFSVLLITLKA